MNTVLNRSISKKSICIFLLIFSFYYNSTAQSHLYLSNDNHTDYMWSADEATYDTAFVSMIDSWMANNNATNANPPDYQTKFNCDGTYWAWAYEKKKTPAQFQQFMNQVKNERIILPINPLIITYGCVPAEATIRGMYYAGELQRKYDLHFDMAMSMENQVLPLGLPSLWKGSGAKYAWHGICNCETQVPGITDAREKEIYWYKGLDDSGVIMKWYTKSSDQVLGNYFEARNPVNAISDLTDKLNTPEYNYNIAGAFGVGADDLETTTDQLAAAAQSNSNASRRVIVSNEVDFFRDFETNYGATLPALTQSYGNEWEHACAAISEVSASIKRSLEKLRLAEAMATVVARTDPSFANTLDSLRKQAWMSLGLYWEHDFEGNGPAVSGDERTAWQRRMEQNFSGYVNQLYTLAKANLANQVKNASSNRRFFVFNPLGWIRTDYVDIAYSGQLPVYITDVSTNTAVRSQIINSNDSQYIRILAADIPSIGYKVFEIRNGTGSPVFENAASADINNRIIDNDYFKIAFTNAGVITSLIDKVNGNKELVNSGSDSDYINNISLNSSFAGIDNSNGSFSVTNNGPVSLSVKIVSAAIINHETLITVFKGIPRVEIDNQITANFGNDFLSNVFSFNNTSISSPTIWHEENGAVINAKKISSGGHYANQQARYDWLTLNHFAAVSSNGSYGLTLSNEDCYFMQTGNSTISNLDENTARIKTLVGGRVDDLGIFFQGNDVIFNQRYAISPFNTYSATTSMKSALEHQNTFVSAFINNASGILPENNFSFINISDSNTLLWALKPAEEGMNVRGAVVRVWNLANTPANAGFVFNDEVTEAENITHIETDVSEASFSNKTVNTTIGKNQLKSYRVKFLIDDVLAIKLLVFTGKKQSGINKLSWKANEEGSFSHYNIERSEDGNNFISVATINGDRSSLYQYDDSNINELKPYYYRLKLVEKNESSSYSNVILIMADQHTADILVYPNPVQNQLKFQLVLNRESRYDIWITDITGKTVMKLPPPLFEPGNNYFTVNTSKLPAGTYTLIVRNAENKYIRKFIKN